MISEFIIKAIIKQSKQEDKDLVLGMFIQHLADGYSYNDDKVNHVLEMLVNPSSFIKPEHINIDYIRNNIKNYIYNYDKLIVRDITIDYIDNLEGLVCINYKYKEKINEERDDINFSDGKCNVSFIDYPQMLK